MTKEEVKSLLAKNISTKIFTLNEMERIKLSNDIFIGKIHFNIIILRDRGSAIFQHPYPTFYFTVNIIEKSKLEDFLNDNLTILQLQSIKIDFTLRDKRLRDNFRKDLNKFNLKYFGK